MGLFAGHAAVCLESLGCNSLVLQSLTSLIPHGTAIGGERLTTNTKLLKSIYDFNHSKPKYNIHL